MPTHYKAKHMKAVTKSVLNMCKNLQNPKHQENDISKKKKKKKKTFFYYILFLFLFLFLFVL